MSTEIKIISTSKGLKDFFLSSDYQYCLSIRKKWDNPKDSAPYAIGKVENEYLFAHDRDELYKALLLWDERNYRLYWHAATEEDYEKLGKDCEPGWWEVEADIEIPLDFELCHYDGFPLENTPIEEVEKWARISILNDDFSMGLLILDRDEDRTIRFLDEGIQEEAGYGDQCS